MFILYLFESQGVWAKWNPFYIKMLVSAFLIALSAISICVISGVVRSIVQPLQRLQQKIQNLAAGDRQAIIHADEDEGEIRELSEDVEQLRQDMLHFETDLTRKTEHEAIGKIATQVAHDLRSPLSSMKAALMMLRDQCGSDKSANEFLNLLQLSGNRLENISNGLLAQYKGEETGIQAFSIHEILDELVGELKASPIGQGARFIKQYHSSALYVSGDKTGVSRALGNIIKNALEAMQQNSSEKLRRLLVSTAIAQSPVSAPSPYGGGLGRGGGDNDLFPVGEGVTIRVSDTGPGIPAEKIPLILKGGHSSGKEGGHGIGTKVVRDIVDAHKGTLAIESEVGVGTTFVITLPVAIQNDDVVVTIPVTVIAGPEGEQRSRVVVIDDEPSLREQWRLTLKAQGVVPEIFSCWEEFESTNKIATPPAVPRNDTYIVDFHFDNSEIDGLEIIRRLKEKGATQIILATAEYWKPVIKDAAQKLRVTLCPKPLPKVLVQNSHLPVEGTSASPSSGLRPPSPKGEGKPGTTVLLIDDDFAIRATWKAMKEKLGIATLHSFANLEAVIQANIQPSECDLCVIDKNIEKSQYTGANMLAYLKQNGARKVILATGEREKDIRNDPAYATIDGILKDKVPNSLDGLLN